ncbi:unnamed protein product [Rotaria socialis]|uniref:Reverse transcriptase Ty1/copia-type domain-containing protein n=1 Tax=Rotaria socialis TaxID=392032 RepID=A0A821UC71_9BILA|nr:unnamed protein product [Rotaria socialis]
MISLGYRRLNFDGCLFVRNEHQLLLVYDYDIIIAAPDDSQLNNMLNELEIVLKIRDLGNVSRILGLDVYDEKERIIVKQTNYIKPLLTNRPDLCFAVGSLARYTEFEHHLFEPGVKRISRYLRGTLELEIVFKKFKSIESIEVFSDSDFATSADGFSISGAILLVNDVPISCFSKRQNSVATSTC